MWFVDRHKYSSAQDAIRCEGELTDVVREVDRRNEPKGGTGLLFPTKVFLEFVLTLESGYYHILSQPFLLGAYRGDFPEEILRVILDHPQFKVVGQLAGRLVTGTVKPSLLIPKCHVKCSNS